MGETVGRFADLTRLPFGPTASDHQDAARSHFRTLLTSTSIRLHDHRPAPKSGVFLLIGAATWSGYDMDLLDRIEDTLRFVKPKNLTLGAFDFDECDSHEAFEKRIPGIGDVLQSPVVGLWVDGKLVQSATGFEARQLAERILLAETSVQNCSLFPSASTLSTVAAS